MRPDTTSSDNSHGKPQRKRPSDRTLLGKTGVSALHEWCGKRKLSPPQFILQAEDAGGFTMSVKVNGKERGRGRGGTKGSAKQEAARQALQALLPGVFFDANGILVELPTLLEDLAPTLASRLAIGEESKKRQPSSRTWDVYPGTSTTSEEDNDYYASRGASVCSALLHAMWQIDDDIPEPPSYTYEVCAATAKRKGIAGSTTIAVHRSSFACTARLIVKRRLSKEGETKKSNDKTEDVEEIKEAKKEPEENETAQCLEEENQYHVETLSAVGTAASKREARHVASAKLLAMLFPECNGMVEVKAAAEAAREKYAASKALKMQSRRSFGHEKRKFNEPNKLPRKRSIDFATPDTSDPPLPNNFTRQIRRILGEEAIEDEEASSADDHDVVSVESLSLSEKAVPIRLPRIEESLSRSLSRRKQLDERVDSALQTMNELDDEGRSLPEELNSNDVGRTVLRRAEMEDADWIQKLLANRDNSSIGKLQLIAQGETPGPFGLLGVSLPSNALSQDKLELNHVGTESLSLPSRLWGSTAITLLLCRVISPKDDPPLGCAVLTLGFSMKEGPTLRIAELVSEPHLPKERFIECLGKFASHMKCVLQNEATTSDASTRSNSLESVYSIDQLKSILRTHLGTSRAEKQPVPKPEEDKGETERQQNGILDLKTISTSLQSVQEEEVEAEEDRDKEDEDTNARRAPKGDKPCKRSRVV